jgi:methyltransferase-like protein
MATILGLQNIKFERADVRDIGPDFGEFDYIISHGVFSWVPQLVADKILAVSAKNLAPNGVSYISYNTLPGWHMRGMIRDMMCYHACQFAQAEKRVCQARAFLKFLADSVPYEKSPYGIYLKNERRLVRGSRDSYIYHDHLEKDNNPVYFYQFIERAESAGLRYLGESVFSTMALAAHDLPANTINTLQKLDLIRQEQYMDFLYNRTFRSTLLCHKEIALDHSLEPEYMMALWVVLLAKPVATKANVFAKEPLEFRLPGGRKKVIIRQSITKAAMMCLSEIWPHGITFDKLCAAAKSRLDLQGKPYRVGASRATRVLAASFYNLYARGFIKLSVREWPSSPPLSERPIASRLARLQAQRGKLVTNLRHQIIAIDELDRRILENLDGHHDCNQLLEMIEGFVANGTLIVGKKNKSDLSANNVKNIMKALDKALARFQRCHLLVG